MELTKSNIISDFKYQRLEVMDLPEEVQEELECPGNDLGQIVNPTYHPKLKQWLEENGCEVKCYIAWWSW
jgi:hypothetical protein